MSAQGQPDPGEVDTGTVFSFLTEWAAQFHDDASPARVTDVLVVFAFIAGLNFAVARPAAAAAVLRRLEVEMPSASEHAALLAQRMLDSMTPKPSRNRSPRPAAFGPSHSS